MQLWGAVKIVSAFAGGDKMLEEPHLMEIGNWTQKTQSAPTPYCVPFQVSHLLWLVHSTSFSNKKEGQGKEMHTIICCAWGLCQCGRKVDFF